MGDTAGRTPVVWAYIGYGDPLTDPPSQLGQIFFDAVLSEDHERAAEVTRHPVEQGAPITDHVRPLPDEITLVGIISNTPIRSDDALSLPLVLSIDPAGPSGFLAGGTSGLITKGLNAIGLGSGGYPPVITAKTLQFLGEKDYVKIAYDTLTRIRDSATLCNVYTPHQTYLNMVVSRVQLHRDRSVGTSGQFEVSFTQIRIVSSNIVDAPLPTVPKAAPTIPKGKQDPTAATGPKQSVALREATNSGITIGSGPASNVGAP